MKLGTADNDVRQVPVTLLPAEECRDVFIGSSDTFETAFSALMVCAAVRKGSLDGRVAEGGHPLGKTTDKNII